MRALALSLLAASAFAAPITFNLPMTVDQEIPAPTITEGSNPRGTANFILDLDTATPILNGTLTWLDMTSTVRAAHIHRINPAAAIPGTGGIVVGFFNAQSFPTSGSYSTPGDISLTATQVNELIAGLSDGSLYVNVHTAVNPPGEIRANIASIPEPGTMVLFAGGLAAVLLLRRR